MKYKFLRVFMEQPKEYNSIIDLIKWLKSDLKQQKDEISKKNGIPKNNINEKDLVLNIGKKDFFILKKENKDKIVINCSIILDEFIDKKTNQINYKINFSNCIFNKIIPFNNLNYKNQWIFNNEIDFSYSIFNTNIPITNIIFNNIVNFEKSLFYNEICIDNSIFNNSLYFSNSIFNSSINLYNNNIFNDIVDFSKSIFNNNVLLMYSEFNNILNFHYSTVKSNSISMINIKAKAIILDNIEITNRDYKLLIKNDYIEYHKYNKFSFNNINLNGKIEIRNIEVNEVDFTNTFIYEGLINPVNFKVNKFANRESALFLKNEAYARNNAIDALQYKAKEVELHKDELIKNKNKTYKDWADILSIGLSSLYSDNGQNWIKALFMTIFITIICFTVFYIPDLTKANIIRLYYKNLFPELIKYFIPTDYSLIIKYAASKLNLFLKIFGVLVYFLGKVLFWYGSVQTVQAFRKFAKGA
ncbi:hypothetical protein SZ41_08690 [Brachyspira hyodysenteriae]|nr:hypothetical protein SZ41_08690 [Brachyspira hyodysenteriae]